MECAVHFETVGCRLNQLETEGLAQTFAAAGYKITADTTTATSQPTQEIPLCVLNTCAVTGKAEQKCRHAISLLLRRFPKAAIVITGCYAQLSAQTLATIDDRLVILPGLRKNRLAQTAIFLKNYLASSSAPFAPNEFAAELRASPLFTQKKSPLTTAEDPFIFSPTHLVRHSRASVKVQDGCNNSCSYCVIHEARGLSVSLPTDVVVKRLATLESQGFAEATLTGVNLSQYEAGEVPNKILLPQLLHLAIAATKSIRIRLSSLDPTIVDDELCRAIRNDRVCPYFHLSVQSGSDTVLRLMRRGYSAETVVQACQKLRAAKGDPFISCDIITGFPAETEENFEETRRLLQECDFSFAHIFPYSERPTAFSRTITPKVPQRVARIRCEILQNLVKKQKISYINRCLGKKFFGVVEQTKGKTFVLTENYLRCALENFYDATKITNGLGVFVKPTRVAQENSREDVKAILCNS